MSTTVTYDPAKIELTIENAGTISSNIASLTESVSAEINSLDIRVFDYFGDFAGTRSDARTLSDETATVDSFKAWMTSTYEDFERTRGSLPTPEGPKDLDVTGDGPQFRWGDIGATTPTYSLTAEAWDKFTTEEKKAMEAKLKELGFTDEEIQAIKDGKAVVNKTTLDKLDSALTKLNNEGSDVRQVILEKYGFDIFNEDGTINRDKLALALMIDGKDPNDDYDLVALLKNKYGIDLFPPEATNPGTGTTPGPAEGTTPPTTDNTGTDNGSTPSTVHTGAGYGGETTGTGVGAGASLDTSEIQNMLDGSEDDSLLDGLGNLSGSLLGGKNGFSIGTAGEGGGGGAVGLATGAGLAGLGLAATAGLLAKKKREKDLVEGEDDDDFDDDFDDDLDLEIDEDELLGDELGKSSLLGSAANTNDGAGTAELNKAADDIDSTKKKKQWLYGLGIGLAGAGLAAGMIAKDDDDDDEEDDDIN